MRGSMWLLDKDTHTHTHTHTHSLTLTHTHTHTHTHLDECKKMRPFVEESISALQMWADVFWFIVWLCEASSSYRQEDEMQAVSDKFQEALQVYRKWEISKLSWLCQYLYLPAPNVCRLLSEGPRLSSSVPSLVQHDAAKQPPSSVAEVSQPPPYHHPASSAVPSQPLPPPQQSLYAADYSLQQPHLVPQQTHHHMTTPSSTPGSWTQNPSVVSQSQPPPLHAYSVPPLQQQRYVSLNASDVVCITLFPLHTAFPCPHSLSQHTNLPVLQGHPQWVPWQHRLMLHPLINQYHCINPSRRWFSSPCSDIQSSRTACTIHCT